MIPRASRAGCAALGVSRSELLVATLGGVFGIHFRDVQSSAFQDEQHNSDRSESGLWSQADLRIENVNGRNGMLMM